MQQRIIRHYGYDNQLGKLVEELRELEQVILYESSNIEHLKEEIADVLNLIEQIVDYQGWNDDVEEIKEYKIRRQIGRIENDR